MRKIIFRGMRIDNNNWVDGSLIVHWYTGECTINMTDLNVYQVDPKTIGQYIGLEDKNNVKIFEGDITSDKLIVTHSEDHGSFKGMSHGWYLQNDNWERWTEINIEEHDIKIIGNIHQDSHLLENPNLLREV